MKTLQDLWDDPSVRIEYAQIAKNYAFRKVGGYTSIQRIIPFESYAISVINTTSLELLGILFD